MHRIDEKDLRLKACEWLRSHFPKRRYLLEPMVFHDVGMTLTNFLKKKFKGKELVSIPKYNSLQIRPDIVAIMMSDTNGKEIPLWLIGECKTERITRKHFRQAKDYAGDSCAYEAYLFYDDGLSSEVMESIQKGGHIYNGTNRWGKRTEKKIIFVNYNLDKLTKQNY